jgi:GNAT superfamily N-acetyltransferase
MTASDIDRIAALTTELGYPSTGVDIARRFERIIGRTDQTVLVAEESGTAVGWLHVAIHPYLELDLSAEILGLVVGETYRSRGIGEALVEAAEAWARGHACAILRVRSRVARERAHAFYERYGFARVKTQHCFEKPIA